MTSSWPTDSSVVTSLAMSDPSFWTSLKMALPFTQEGRVADYAEERLEALDEINAELARAHNINNLIKNRMHDKALAALLADTEGQSYSNFHRHRHTAEMAGEWSFLAPSERLRLKRAGIYDKSPMLAKHHALKQQRKERISTVRDLCLQVTSG